MIIERINDLTHIIITQQEVKLLASNRASLVDCEGGYAIRLTQDDPETKAIESACRQQLIPMDPNDDELFGEELED